MDNSLRLYPEFEDDPDYLKLLDIASSSLHQARQVYGFKSFRFVDCTFNIFSKRCFLALPASSWINTFVWSKRVEYFNFLLLDPRVGFLRQFDIVEFLSRIDYKNPLTVVTGAEQHARRVDLDVNSPNGGFSSKIQAKDMEPIVLMHCDITVHPIFRSIAKRSFIGQGQFCENDNLFHELGLCEWCDLLITRFLNFRNGRREMNRVHKNFHFAVHAWHTSSRHLSFNDFYVITAFARLKGAPSVLQYFTCISRSQGFEFDMLRDLVRPSDRVQAPGALPDVNLHQKTPADDGSIKAERENLLIANKIHQNVVLGY